MFGIVTTRERFPGMAPAFSPAAGGFATVESGLTHFQDRFAAVQGLNNTGIDNEHHTPGHACNNLQILEKRV
jgi:hypothetical protein